MQTQLEERQAERANANAPLPRVRLIAAIALLIGLAVLVGVVGSKWPFTELAMLRSLQEQSGTQVQVTGFRQTYFPHPGCVADGVTFRKGNAQPFITIQKLTVAGSYHGLLTNHLKSIRADGFRLVIDKQTFSGALGKTSPGLTIGEIIADGAEIAFPAQQKGEEPLVFRIPKLALHDVADTQPLRFETTVQLPKPVAEVEVTGKFGPWRAGQTAQTRLSGSYALHRLDLGSFAGLAGQMIASGKFDGELQGVKVEGSLDAPDFEVRQSKHPVHLVAQYDATVNGLNGDVEIDAARAHFRGTTIFGAGTVSGEGLEQGKAVTAELSSKQARIEDLLWLFVSGNQPAMAGPIVFRAKVQLPPENRSFTKKVKLEGDFGVSNAQYPNATTQKNIDLLSARARGQADKVEDQQDKVGNNYDPGKVLSDVKGHVVLNDGIAHLSNVSFAVPGAQAFVSGTYSLLTEKVDLSGHMRLEAELSKATTGVKSVLLKVMQPFMHKSKHQVSVVAIRIGGTYGNPTYTAVPKAEK